MLKPAILLIDCPDRKGIVVTIINFLVDRYDVNILNADQHQDAELGLFFTRIEFTTATFASAAAAACKASFAEAFTPVAEAFAMNWRLELAEAPQNVALFVSQYLHCLADLLHRYQTAELRCNVARVSQNDQLSSLIAKGRDLERLVLSRAVQWHLDHRILSYANKTVIFA